MSICMRGIKGIAHCCFAAEGKYYGEWLCGVAASDDLFKCSSSMISRESLELRMALQNLKTAPDCTMLLGIDALLLYPRLIVVVIRFDSHRQSVCVVVVFFFVTRQQQLRILVFGW